VGFDCSEYQIFEQAYKIIVRGGVKVGSILTFFLVCVTEGTGSYVTEGIILTDDVPMLFISRDDI
jgi:hypothetical protein